MHHSFTKVGDSALGNRMTSPDNLLNVLPVILLADLWGLPVVYKRERAKIQLFLFILSATKDLM